MAKPKNMKLYDKIKAEVYEKYPKHSLFRSALIVKKYKQAGGEYLEEAEKPKMNIKKWFGQEWLSANDYLRGKEVPCGSASTQKEYNEYPLCRPKKTLEEIPKASLKKMIEEKNKIKSSHLKTAKILKTNKFNVK